MISVAWLASSLVSNHTIDQAVLLRVAAALAEFLGQIGASRIKMVVYKRRLRHRATECYL